jgi:hypothetical protein
MSCAGALVDRVLRFFADDLRHLARDKLLDMRCAILSRFLREDEWPMHACFWLEWALANYSEQVMISKSLTLQGIINQNTSGATVTSFSGSVAESQVLGLDLIPAIWVAAGTVNISNLLVPIDQRFENSLYSANIEMCHVAR